MPDLTATELILGALASLGVGGSASMTIARRRPGVPDDCEQRLAALEDRITRQETRMNSLETTLAQALGKLNDSTDRMWRAMDATGEKIDRLAERVVALDIEAAVERELRKRNQTEKPKP